jgi:hypothetical protein
MSEEMPEWLVEKSEEVVENFETNQDIYTGMPDYYELAQACFQECFKIMSETQKPQPIETAPRDTNILLNMRDAWYQGWINKDSSVFVLHGVGPRDIKHYDKWLPLPSTEEK